MRSDCALLLAQAALAAASLFQAQTPLQTPASAILNPRVEAAIHSILNEFNSPGGVAVAVVRRWDSEWVVETKGYGFATADGAKITEDTLFAIGSNSKLFDALATGLLVHNESIPQLSWNTKVASVIPEWALMDVVASSETTLIDLLSHRSGLPRHDGITRPTGILDTIQRLRYLKPSAGFRETFQYNNHQYTVLSHLPLALTGTPFEHYVDKFILQPLGMTSTTYFHERAEESGRLADGFSRDGVNKSRDLFELGQARVLPFWDQTENESGRSSSSPTLLEKGRHPVTNESIIPAETIQKVSAGITVGFPVALYPELSPLVYGGGQQRGTYRGAEIIEHGGAVPGFLSYISRIPSLNLGVAVFSNDESFGNEISSAIKYRLVDEALGLPPIDWTERFKQRAIAAYNNRVEPVSRPSNPTPPSFALTGTYHDPGYGTLELCLVSPKSTQEKEPESCASLRSEAPTLLPGIDLSSVKPTLLARWRGFMITHISFTHFDGNVFNSSGLNSLPTGNNDEYWVQTLTDSSFLAEFALSEESVVGMSWRGIWGAGGGVGSPEGGSAKDRAEVWFAKIK
ncbi:beta-lactamase/transpeptidase-like protein [Mycena amicta]|nr:beta-lactamase/transpeptidase-like protein [Mycena amicta]